MLLRWAKTSLAGGNRNKRNRSQARKRKPAVESLEARQLLTTVSFQQGLGGYEGQEDTVLYSRDPDVNAGTEGSISPDQQDSNGVRQGLVKFADIIGDDSSQVPLGAKINSATFTVDVVNDSNSAMQMSLYRMQQDWSEGSATWNTFGAIGGVQASEGESSDLPPDAILFDPDTSASSPTAGIFDVTRSLEYWSAGVNNFGWMIESAATNGWDFRTKESAQNQRPRLVVDYSVPASLEYQILNTSVVSAEGNTGTSTAIIEVARLGDLTAGSSIDFDVTAGTATAGVDFVASSGTLNFAPNQGLATIEVIVNGDTELEGFETIDVTLSGGTTVAGRGAAVISIGDDDALINEVLANVSNDIDETNREYIELLGTPGASLDDYWFVVFEGEEEEGSMNGDGTGLGVADFVANLDGLTFGSNGLLVLAPTNWEYAPLAAAGTNIVNTAALDGLGGVLEDASQTYALIRSSAAITQGTDYDTVGTYENDTNQAIGTGVGILDQLPAGAEVVDFVGVVEGGGGDRDRVLTPEALGHPGIHVHQPTRINANSGNVTSDAVSRRAGNTLANSIGVWYNGDIGDGDPNGPITYENDTFFISVVAPDGAALTPGAPNDLRTVFFSLDDQEVEIPEADGSVTVTIERTGDLSEDLTIEYQTVDVTAVAGQDYTATSGMHTFSGATMEDSFDLTIPILQDMNAEGFERFRVEITSATGEYLITNGQSTQVGAVNGQATVTIADANVEIASFQQFVNGYTGTSDTYLDGEQITDEFGFDTVVRVDQVKGEGEDVAPAVRPQQGMLRFDDVFGPGINQIPEGSTIFGGFLTVNVQNVSSGADVRFFRMLQDWSQGSANFLDPQGIAGNSIVNGVTPDDIEATADPDAVVPDAGLAGLVEIPLNADTLQGWANGSLENFGWSIVNDSGSLWAFNSADSFGIGTFAPELTVLYTAPEATTGTFSLSVDDYYTAEDTAATITVNRIGGSTGAATVDWSLAAGTGDLSDVSGATSGSVMFADGELSKTFDVVLNDDSTLEVNETIDINIGGAGLDFARDLATLTIRDNDFSALSSDILLNEMWINSPGNDPPHEFVELKGTADVPLGSLYYVAIEGLVGDREGSAEKVVNLGSFANGSAQSDGSGYTLLTPDAADFAFNVPAATTQIDALGSIAQENVASQNDSTTYMILYSPFTRLTETEFDYDWDNDGALELPLGVQIVDSVGVRVEGSQDQLYGPGSNEAEFAVTDPDVDAISRDLTDTTRNEGDAWYGGDLEPAGDDYLLYEVGESFGVPATGGALSPGEPNAAASSALVSIVSANISADGTTGTLVFDGPVSQNNVGDGGPGTLGAGIVVADAMGNAIATVDLPNVDGFFTNTLTLSFSGSGVPGGVLPDGDYTLVLEGNALIGNARAVDVVGDGTQIDSQATYGPFTVMGGGNVVDGDFNNDGNWDTQDVDLLSAAIAASSSDLSFDMDGDGSITIADLTDATDGWLTVGGANNPGQTGGNAFLPGDGNLDGVVDGQDFITWNANKFSANDAYSNGDFNADGVVDGQDFITWNANKFQSSNLIAPLTPTDSTVAESVEAPIQVMTQEVVATAPVQRSSARPVIRTLEPLAHQDVDEEDARYEDNVDLIFAGI
ncbi:MAG: Calx-beta domain-containing protein [Planctomycetota bacterium]